MALSHDQKIAALVVPVLLFGVLGAAGAASAHYYARNLTDEQQEAVAEARELREEGEYEAAHELLEEAGVAHAMGPGHGAGPRAEAREAIREAVDEGDYEAFLAATEDAPFADMVDEEFFDTLVKAHDLREAGNYEGARELMAEYGLGPAGGMGMGTHGMHRGHGHGWHE